MPTPLPTPDTVLLEPPDQDEVNFITRGLMSASQPAGGPTELQSVLLVAITKAMTGVEVRLDELEPISAADFGVGLARRDEAHRTRMVQLMELLHMVLPAPDIEVADRVIDFAGELMVDNDCVHIARELAEGSRQLVAADVDRSAYLTELDLSEFTPLRTAEDNVQAWTASLVDDGLAQAWCDLGDLPEGTLGRGVHDFYRARGFHFPGQPGSAPPLLAQHDWVHVIADYGSRVESELEVFAFIARASDNPTAFTLLAMALNLFQTGALPQAAGFFEADPGHLAANGMPERLADAMRRGALCHGSNDFLAMDFFAMADQPITQVREHFGVVPKSAEAIAAGSRGPWEPGGISEFQMGAGPELAASLGIEYDPCGATSPHPEPTVAS